jgi:hypothetical protein
MDTPDRSYSTFDGFRRLVTGSLAEAALACRHALAAQPDQPVLIIDNASGRNIDVALEGSDEELAARLAPRPAPPTDAEPAADAPRGRGRPKLGVVPREVTLLPRHWEWLATQPGGASVTLRRLVEDARRSHADRDRMRRAQGRAYQFMLAVAGDLPGYEEATRALFANDHDKLEREIALWPSDVREHALMLACIA